MLLFINVGTRLGVNPRGKKTDSLFVLASLVKMDLATLKEENKLAPTALISQVFAPRYMTRSRAVSENIASDEAPKFDEDDVAPPLATVKLVTNPTPQNSNEWESSSDTQAPPSELAAIDTPSSQAGSASLSSRKRGRHKEYTAPTGVWKTNGGYISTIYVGNRRIYGPLRDNPEEAGLDRQKLIEAKSFAKTEADMRTFIASLKGGNTSNFVITNSQPTPTEPSHGERSTTSAKRKRPTLTTCTSTTTIIEVSTSVE